MDADDDCDSSRKSSAVHRMIYLRKRVFSCLMGLVGPRNLDLGPWGLKLEAEVCLGCGRA